MTNIDNVAALGAPLRRALHQAGFDTPADLNGQPSTALLNLHGVGNAGVNKLTEAMAAEGHALAEGHMVWTATDQGAQPLNQAEPKELKTSATDVVPAEWIRSLPWPRRVEQRLQLLTIFRM